MTPPEHGHAALYIKCPVCASWNLHVAGTEGAVAATLNAPRFNGWRCPACKAEYPATMHMDAREEARTK